MKCPNCQATLQIADKQGIEIDYCPECRGIWLDRGELDKIIERSAQHYSNRDNYESDYKKYGYKDYDNRPHQGQHPHHPHKKKKSFLDDFFDFG